MQSEKITQKLGRYRNRFKVNRNIGSGLYSNIYEAVDYAGDGNCVAVKVLDAGCPPLIQNSFREEFKAMTRCRHPHLVSVLDLYWGGGNGALFYTMELVPGKPLDRCRMTYGEILGELIGAISGLKYIHGQGLVHGRLCPWKLMVECSRQGDGFSTLKILDFGAGSMRLMSPSPDTSMEYHAPEMLTGGASNPQADLFSLGLIFLELISGKPYHKDRSALFRWVESHWSGDPVQAQVWRRDADLDMPREVAEILARMMSENPASRYHCVEDILSDLEKIHGPWAGSLRPSMLLTSSEGLFTGRENELSECKYIWKEIENQRRSGSALIIEGVPGIGKSRFLRELAAEMRSNQVPVVSICCTHQDYRFGGFPSAIRSILHLLAGPDMTLSREMQRWMNPPETGPSDEQYHLDPEGLTQQVIELILRAGQISPYIIIFNNFHLSDNAGLEMFIRLTRALNRAPVLLVAEMQTSTLPVSIRRMIRDCQDEKKLEVIGLEKLGNEEIRCIAEAILGGGLPAELLERLIKGSNGIPLHLEEILRLMVQEKTLVRRAGKWDFQQQNPSALQTVSKIRELMTLRLKQLEPEYIRIIQLLAVIGRPADVKCLSGLFPQVDTQYWILPHLQDMGILQKYQWKQVESYFFVHHSMPEFVLEMIQPAARKRLHQKIAAYLDMTLADIEEVAFHYLRGGSERKAARSAFKAALQCLNAGAVERAEKFLAAGASRLNSSDRTLAIRFHYYQAYVAILRSEVEDIIRYAELGLAKLPKSFPKRLQMKARLYIFLAEGYSKKAMYQDALKYLDVAESLLEKRYPQERMDAMVRRAGVLIFMSRLDESRKAALKALTLESKIQLNSDSYRKLGNTYNTLGYLYKRCGDTESALNYYRKALELGKKMQNIHWLAAIHNNLGELYLFMGNIVEAKRNLDKSCDCYRVSGLNLSSASPLLNLGTVYMTLGQNNTAQRYYENALDLYRQAGRRGYILEALENLFRLFISEWKFQQAEDCFREIEEISDRIDSVEAAVCREYYRGILALNRGYFEDAYRPLLQAAWFSRQNKIQTYQSRIHCAISRIHLEFNRIQSAVIHGRTALKAAKQSGDYTDQVHSLINLASADRYSGDPIAAEAVLNQAEGCIQKKMDPVSAYRIDLERLKLTLETRPKQQLMEMVLDLRHRVSEFHHFDLLLNTELIVSKCAAKLGMTVVALKIIEEVHRGVIACNHRMMDWQVSRVKARFLYDHGLVSAGYTEFEAAHKKMSDILANIGRERWIHQFRSRRDVRMFFDFMARCRAELNVYRNLVQHPFLEDSFPLAPAPDSGFLTLSHTARMVLTTFDLDKVFGHVAQAFKRFSDGDNAFVMTLDSKQKLWIQKIISDAPDRNFRIREQLAMTAGTIAMDSGQIVTSRDILSDPRFLETGLYRKIGARSLVCVPLLSKNKPVGVLYSDTRVPNSEKILNHTAEFMFLGDITAISIENVRLYADLDSMFVGVVKSLAAAIDAKDPYTRGHSQRVRDYAVAIGEELGISPEIKRNLELAAFLHDIGKIGIPEGILAQPGPLDAQQAELMQRHPEIGAEILSPIDQLERVSKIILQHHERYDGTGYPKQAVMDEITLEARILSIADSLDAITSSRPYRGNSSLAEALTEIKNNAGGQFDPRCVKILEAAIERGIIVIPEN